MIPIQLSLEGIYSYQTRQTIDFTELTNGGLFGIFGAVASGKSTILEAISFALYGESERMGGISKNYNMMNLKSDRMYVEFDFFNSENKKYRVVREYRRNSKNFENVLLCGTTFYEWINNAWIPLDHCSAERIIGLSAANFKRTIIIPQGKFKEFIELGGSDRTSMMKEIFDLHRFDLANDVKALYGANQEKLNTLIGQLIGYDAISEETIADKQKHYEKQKTSFDKQLIEHKKLSEAFEELKHLSLDFKNLQQQNNKLASEETKKKEIDENEKSLKLYEKTFQQFDEILRLKQQLSQKIMNENNNLHNHEKELSSNQESSKEVAERLAKLKPFIDNIESKKQEVVDLQLISQVLNYRAAIKKGQERTINGRAVVETLTKKLNSFTKTVNDTDREIENIKDQLFDSNTLTSIELWFANYSTLSKQVADRVVKLGSLAKEIKAKEESFQELGYPQDNWRETIELKREVLSKQQFEANEQRNQLLVKQQIAHFANEIHDGAACPLCGSFEHPNVIETEDVSTDILNNSSYLKIIEQQINEIAATELKLIQLQEAKNSLNTNMAEVEAELVDLNEEKQHHLSLFVWEGFSSTDEGGFKAKKIANDKMMVEKEQLEIRQKENRAQIDITNANLSKSRDLLIEIENENKYNETLIVANISKIKLLQLTDFENQTTETITHTISERELLIQKNLYEHTTLEKQKNELLQAISAQIATKEAYERQIAQLCKEEKQNNAAIQSKLAESSFESTDEIEQLLSNKRNVDAERALIDSFKINYAKLKQSIEELENKLEGKSFSSEEFEVKKQEHEDSENQINKLRVELGTSGNDLKRIEKEYEEKKELLKEKEKLEARKANISTLTQLFKASGFVNYVSSIYLKNLCAIANERFHRLTKNQLSLQINDKNEFEIKDYLNNGRTRSVRTLSGGQNFQVSLSLALALAENVQSLTKSEKNFFFIDEGFGTQDAESVNIVFETLNNLQKGNRIVGIISHVEELQERIPKSLFIRKDLEKGSLIETIG